ncbi:MAG: ribonuclease Z [Oscillospiraceae bacterium]|nr:ribonuclease Z [Oscillospiraceae bacterium]
MLDICLAGTGGMKPLPDRFLTGLWLEHDGYGLLIDCGEGMQVALAKHGCKTAKMDTLLITHIHADHIAVLPGLLLTAGNGGRCGVLNIYGPKGTEKAVRSLMCITPELAFDVKITELTHHEITSFKWHDITVSALPMRHKVPCLGYRFTENRPPVFDPQRAMELGIPKMYWKLLHSGETVEHEGKTYSSKDISKEDRAPLILTYMTDTVYFDRLSEYAADSDLLICEGMYGSDEYIPKMKDKMHLVYSQAAYIAKKSASKRLWLTHYSPANENPKKYDKTVKEYFPDITISRDGERLTLK